jgi:hypothetical protein
MVNIHLLLFLNFLPDDLRRHGTGIRLSVIRKPLGVTGRSLKNFKSSMELHGFVEKKEVIQ